MPYSDTSGIPNHLCDRSSRRTDPPNPAREPRSASSGVALALALLALPGCGAPDTSEQLTGDAYDRETRVFSEISRLDFAAVGRAYDALSDASFRIRTIATQKGADGIVIATETKEVRFHPSGTEVEELSTEGTMSTGFMTFAVEGDSIPDMSREVAELWTPDEPAFISPRNRDFYRFGQGRDTVAAGERCITFEVNALDGVSPDRMPIRAVRVVVAASDSSILALRIRRQDDAIFYHEKSTLEMTLRRGPDRTLLPSRRGVSVAVKAPLRSPHYFDMTQEYLFAGEERADRDGITGGSDASVSD